MNHLEQYLDRVMKSESTDPKTGNAHVPKDLPILDMEPVSETHEEKGIQLLIALFRRWYIIVGIFIVFLVISIPCVWIFVEPGYVAKGYIRIEPAVKDILTGDFQEGESAARYDYLVYTYATTVLSPNVIQRVADELSDKNLSFFMRYNSGIKNKIVRFLGLIPYGDNPTEHLKRAISLGIISASPKRNTQLIEVKTKSLNKAEAVQIVNSIIRNYMAVYSSGISKESAETLRILEDNRKVLEEKLKQGRKHIRELADQYGSTALESRQDMMVQRVTTFLDTLTKLEAQRIQLEIQIQMMEGEIDQNQPVEAVMTGRNAYISADPMMQELNRSIIELQKELITAKQVYAPGNPLIPEKEQMLRVFKDQMEAKREELGREFDEKIQIVTHKEKETKLANAKASLNQIIQHEKALRKILDEQDNESREVGRTNLDIQDLLLQVDLDRDYLDRISRRIKQLEMERRNQAQVNVHAWADIQEYQDKRLKYSATLAFGAFGFGCIVAFFLDKMDKRLRTPNDAALCTRLPLIGTITSSNAINPALFAEQITSDYQAIRANLGLLSHEGMPRKLVITSSGTQEGKTTFCINLATSLARSGKRVLLIDGDMRKPNVVTLMNSPEIPKRSHKVTDGDGFDYTIYTIPSNGLDILVPHCEYHMDAYELVSSPRVAKRVDILAQKYEHVIIDTPPTLAFPDALEWAKIAKNVLIVSFAGRTTAPDLAEARQRLAASGARIVGTVMNNVSLEQSYRRYGYDYYYRPNSTGKSIKYTVSSHLLTTSESQRKHETRQ